MAKQPKDDPTASTVDAIILLASEVRFDGKQWKRFADELYNREVTTVTGKSFNSESLRSFCKRNEIVFPKIKKEGDSTDFLRKTDSEATEVEMKVAPKPEALPKPVAVLPRWLVKDLDTLKAIIEWWKAKDGIPQLHAEESRPVFNGKTRNSGIRVNEEILRRAVNKARQDKTQTGGNLSQLVEWLMWKYIGEPPDVVKGSDLEK